MWIKKNQALLGNLFLVCILKLHPDKKFVVLNPFLAGNPTLHDDSYSNFHAFGSNLSNWFFPAKVVCLHPFLDKTLIHQVHLSTIGEWFAITLIDDEPGVSQNKKNIWSLPCQNCTFLGFQVYDSF